MRKISRRERSHPRKIIKETRSDLETNLIKKRAPAIHSPEYLVRKVIAPHLRPTRFQVACTYLDGSCSAKQILAMRLSQGPWTQNQPVPGQPVGRIVASPTTLLEPRLAINYILSGPTDDQYQSKRQQKRLVRAAMVKARVNVVHT